MTHALCQRIASCSSAQRGIADWQTAARPVDSSQISTCSGRGCSAEASPASTSTMPQEPSSLRRPCESRRFGQGRLAVVIHQCSNSPSAGTSRTCTLATAHGPVVRVDPDDFLVRCHFEHMRPLPKLTVSQPIRENGVAVWQAVQPTQERQMHVGQIGLGKFPHRLAFRIHFEDARSTRAVTTGDERIAIGQSDDAMRPSAGRNLARHATLRIVLPHKIETIMGDQVVAVS